MSLLLMMLVTFSLELVVTCWHIHTIYGVIYLVLSFFLESKMSRSFVRKTIKSQAPPDLKLRAVREVKIHNIVIRIKKVTHRNDFSYFLYRRCVRLLYFNETKHFKLISRTH